MSLSTNLDIKESSIWKIHTPNIQTKQMPFHMNEIGTFECGSKFFTRRNEQRDFEIIYTLEGIGEIIYNETSYTLGKNQAFILDCYNLHHYKTIGPYWKFNWLHLSGASAELYYNYISRDSNFINLKDFSFFDFNFNILLNLSTEQSIQISFMACQYIQTLLTELFVSNSSLMEKSRTTGNIQIVLDHVKKHYKEQVKLDSLCDLIHLSKYYLIHIFKNHTGSTPNEYIINFRIGKAKELLRTTELSIKEICLDVGFSDESYFIKTFKRLNGITPNKYRTNF